MDQTLTWRYRGGVAARAVTAIGGGYLLAATSMALLVRLLPMARADAVILATMLAFVVYLCAVLWVFAVASAWRALLGIGTLCVLFTLAGRFA